MEMLSTAWTRARNGLHSRMERLEHQRRLELGHAAYDPAEGQVKLDTRTAQAQTAPVTERDRVLVRQRAAAWRD